MVLAFKLFSFPSYIFIVVAKCCNCTSSTCIEKYTVGLDLPPQNVLPCVFGLEGISGKKVFIDIQSQHKKIVDFFYFPFFPD